MNFLSDYNTFSSRHAYQGALGNLLSELEKPVDNSKSVNSTKPDYSQILNKALKALNCGFKKGYFASGFDIDRRASAEGNSDPSGKYGCRLMRLERVIDKNLALAEADNPKLAELHALVKKIQLARLENFAKLFRKSVSSPLEVASLHVGASNLHPKSSPILASPSRIQPIDSGPSFLPMIASVMGLAGGVFFTLIATGSVHTSISDLEERYNIPGCKPLIQLPIISQLNYLKHKELTTIAFASPVLIALSSFIYRFIAIRKESVGVDLVDRQSRLIERFKKASKDFPGYQLLTTVALTGTFSALSWLCSLNKNYYKYDVSGHVMVNAAATYGLMEALHYMINSGLNKKIEVGLTALCFFKDEIGMFITAACKHSVAETAGGLGLAALVGCVALSLKGPASKVAKKVENWVHSQS